MGTREMLAGWLAVGVLLALAGPAQATTFSSNAPITINDGTNSCQAAQQTPATPYPSSIPVATSGAVTDVNVTLTNLTHSFPRDLRVLLVAPSGVSTLLMHQVGEGDDAVDQTLTFDDEASGSVPTPIVTGTYKPTQFDSGCNAAIPIASSLPSPAPPGPYGATLGVFDGGGANGNWSLYVVDESNQDVGDIEGWCLAIETELFAQGSCTAQPTYSEEVLAGSPAGYWRMGEASGTTMVDSSGNGNNGTYLNGPLLGQAGALVGDPDTAASFDGVNDTARVPDANSLDVGDSFTLEGWVKRSSVTKSQTLFNKGANGFQLVVMNGGSASQVWLRKAGVTTIAKSTVPVPADGAFHHVVATKDGTSVVIYVDGVAGTTVLAANQVVANTAFPLTFADAGSTQHTFDEFALYDTVLPSCEVGDHHATGVNGPYVGC